MIQNIEIVKMLYFKLILIKYIIKKLFLIIFQHENHAKSKFA